MMKKKAIVIGSFVLGVVIGAMYVKSIVIGSYVLGGVIGATWNTAAS
mgnify:CR=1 FL=1